MKKDTFCALSTAPGQGALSLIRVSGPEALKSVRKLARFLPPEIKTHQAYVGRLKHEREFLDEVVVTYFKEGRSFTGEETLEISCHGGNFISHKILASLYREGVRPAERGEFSLVAFLNGKLDLPQAEGILQLIESKNAPSHRVAFSQLEGRFSKKLEAIKTRWLFVLSHVEAEIDFSLEDIPVLEGEDLKKELLNLKTELEDILSRYRPFEELKKGLSFTLLGPVNAGKSSLFNCLLGEKKALVTSEAGTTRDPVEGTLFSPSGLNVSLKDTAGFRETQSKPEQLAQEKGRDLSSSSDFLLFILEGNIKELKKIKGFLKEECFPKTFFVFTKKDLFPKVSKEDLLTGLKALSPFFKTSFSPEKLFFVSSHKGEGLQDLRHSLLRLGDFSLNEEILVSNERHFAELKVMQESLKKSLLLLGKEGERDLLALELRLGLEALSRITGESLSSQVLDQIFKQFCIGK